jgi:hypothetical protein
MHFDEWSRGEGKYGPQKQRRDAGAASRDVAREYWSFCYDPSQGTISLGPYTINIDVADKAAEELSHAICLAAHQVDIRNTVDLRAKTVAALVNAGISCDAPDSAVIVSSGNDLRIWVTLGSRGNASDIAGSENLARRLVNALDGCNLRLASTNMAEAFDPAERIVRGEMLYVAI